MIRNSFKFLTLVLAASLTVAPISAIGFGSIFSQARTYTASIITTVKNNALPIAALLAGVAAMAVGKNSGYSYLQSAAVGSMVISACGIYFNQHSSQKNNQNVVLNDVLINIAQKNDQIPLNIPTTVEKTGFYNRLMLYAKIGLMGRPELGVLDSEMFNKLNHDGTFRKLVTELYAQIDKNESSIYAKRELSDEEVENMSFSSYKQKTSRRSLSEEEAYNLYPLLTQIKTKLGV